MELSHPPWPRHPKPWESAQKVVLSICTRSTNPLAVASLLWSPLWTCTHPRMPFDSTTMVKSWPWPANVNDTEWNYCMFPQRRCFLTGPRPRRLSTTYGVWTFHPKVDSWPLETTRGSACCIDLCITKMNKALVIRVSSSHFYYILISWEVSLRLCSVSGETCLIVMSHNFLYAV